MRKSLLWLAIFMFIAGITSVSAQDGVKDLNWAKSLLEHGDYAYAAQKFEDIASSHYNSAAVRKEAMYYVGYCHVKNNDPWQAMRVLEQFIEKYDNGSSTDFVPDALYVLGRVYEETGDNSRAIKVYQRCRRTYPRSSFARKAEERLQALGGSGNTDPFDGDYTGGDGYEPGNGNGHGHDHGHGHGDNGQAVGVSREIRQLLRIAETVNNDFTRDQMLLEGSDRARTGEDFVALANAVKNDFTRSQLLDRVSKNKNYNSFTTSSMLGLAALINNSYSRDMFLVNYAGELAKRDYVSNYEFVEVSAAMNNDALRQQLFDTVSKSIAFKFINARTMVELAQTCKNSYIHDQLLLTAAQKNKYSYRDLRILADACSNSFTKTQILQVAGDDNHHSPYRPRPSRNSPQAELARADYSDPFAGFNFNKAQIKRIHDFMKAIDSKKRVKETVTQLKKSDLSTTTVREYMEKYQTLQKFENLHQR